MDYETQGGPPGRQNRKNDKGMLTAVMICVAILLAIVVGVAVYVLSNSASPVVTTPMATGGAVGGGGGAIMRGGGAGGGKTLIPGGKASDFLNADGTVNEARIQEDVNSKQAPTEMMYRMVEAREQQIDEALAAGEITSQQATALKEAWRSTAGF